MPMAARHVLNFQSLKLRNYKQSDVYKEPNSVYKQNRT